MKEKVRTKKKDRNPSDKPLKAVKTTREKEEKQPRG